MKVCVVDGQGGGIGSAVVKRIKEEFGERVEVFALGTNAIATAQMMKARANRGGTGENAIRVSVRDADAVIGPISIIIADSMMGEVTAGMVAAIGRSRALKLLIPLTQERLEVAGVKKEPLPHYVEEIVTKKLKELLNDV